MSILFGGVLDYYFRSAGADSCFEFLKSKTTELEEFVSDLVLLLKVFAFTSSFCTNSFCLSCEIICSVLTTWETTWEIDVWGIFDPRMAADGLLVVKEFKFYFELSSKFF